MSLPINPTPEPTDSGRGNIIKMSVFVVVILAVVGVVLYSFSNTSRDSST